jgi:flavin reductase (DIM6/NTAB) family NADH-FMN oxidoreductase RutF
MPVTKDEFRTALSRFASGVTVVTTTDGHGKPFGMTVSAFSSLSLEPPLILICIDKKASGHGHFSPGSTFAVNILAEDQEEVSRRFASRDVDRFNGIGYRSGTTGVPLLEGAIARIECRVTDIYAGGDHTIVVGELVATEVSDGKPLAYYRGGYAQLA